MSGKSFCSLSKWLRIRLLTLVNGVDLVERSLPFSTLEEISSCDRQKYSLRKKKKVYIIILYLNFDL